MFGIEIHSEDQLLGKARLVGVLGATGGAVQHYFSSSCKGILKAGTVGKLCRSCFDFDAVLQCRLYRARSTRENVKDQTRVNIRYMNRTNVQNFLEEGQSKRRNAERREKYAKRKLNAEKELKPIAEDAGASWHLLNRGGQARRFSEKIQNFNNAFSCFMRY